MQGCVPLYLRELLVKQANTGTLRSNTKNSLQIPHTTLKRFGDRVVVVVVRLFALNVFYKIVPTYK